jgi:hypothetical protein
MPGAFAKISGAQESGGGNIIRDGNYKLLIEKVHMLNGHNGECFIAEMRVLESAASGLADEFGKPVIPNPVGSTCSLVCNITKYDAAAGTAKKFIRAALAGLGMTPEEVGDQLAQARGQQRGSIEDTAAWVCGDENPLHGVLISDNTYRTSNKGRANSANAGKPITNHGWQGISQTPENIQVQRKWLSENKPSVDAAAPAQMAAAVQSAVGTPAAAPAAPAAKPSLAGSPLGNMLGIK